MRNREIALSVGPRAAPALPITVDPTGSIAAPPALHAAVFDTEIVDVAPDCASEIRIGRGNDDLAFFSDVGAPPRHAFVARSLKSCIPTRPVGILDPDIADDPGQGIGMRIGLQREIVVAIKMRPGDAAMLGRPIAVDILRHDMPHAECLHRRRSRLRAESRDTQRPHVVAFEIGEVRRVRHYRLQECHTRFQNSDIVPLDHRRKATGVRKDRRSFRNHARHPRHQWRADQIGLAGDPARISNDEHRIARPCIERHGHRMRNARRIAMHVDDPFGLSGGARRVDEEHRIIGVDRQRLRRRPDCPDEIGVAQRKQVILRFYFKPNVSRLCEQGLQ